ncbi:hypothetical protein [Thermoflavimicrobium dichotomicum]|uniref:Uncharacterized protein n=1 Tax=Thermoflavimicrobium dichotomicum TaxID=46223 RepID=A0A1I3RIR7_9BACL|nr:hypothetical protein [Thermoflavimicrobium dichotomicum]SFJ46165.1 hypothetical protein SAMN05421852_11048 [Thermoflavimicrobium dichotomicum]
MHTKAAIFACRVTGGIGMLASLLFLKLYGAVGLIAGLIGSGLWFGLASYLKKSSTQK